MPKDVELEEAGCWLAEKTDWTVVGATTPVPVPVALSEAVAAAGRVEG